MFSYHATDSKVHLGPIKQKLSVLLTIVISFQEKIQSLKEKLCSFPDFSPELYYSEIDKNNKGHIDKQDLVVFLKTYKGNLKVQSKYLSELIKSFNVGEVKNSERLSYFGYLNIIKPYFNKELVKDLLMRDTIVQGKVSKILNKNENIIKLLNELISLQYVCVAEHEQIKELISSQYFLSIRQIISILFDEKKNDTRTVSTLTKLCSFINENSDYEIDQSQMKFLLGFLSTHQYLLTNQKEMTRLFIPSNEETSSFEVVDAENQMRKHQVENKNFLNFVHPNSQKNLPIVHQNEGKPLLNQPQYEEHIQTPILQRFFKESKVMKNVSKRREENENNSAFLQESVRGMKMEPVYNIEDILYGNKEVNKSEFVNLSKYEKKKNEYEIGSGNESQGILGNFLLK